MCVDFKKRHGPQPLASFRVGATVAYRPNGRGLRLDRPYRIETPIAASSSTSWAGDPMRERGGVFGRHGNQHQKDGGGLA